MNIGSIKFFLTLLITVVTLTFVSCDINRKCDDLCDNGYCSDGDCVCDYGYSGEWCETYTPPSSSSGGSSSGGSSSGGSSSGSGGLCLNTCQYAYDGECDDGGPGAAFSLCDYGTDCADCGIRYGSSSSSGGSSSSSSGGSSTGQLMVWNSNSQPCPAGAGNTIAVYVNGSYYGGLSTYYTSAPSCGASGTVTLTLNPGSYTVTGSCGTTTWGPTYVTVTAGSCYSLQLY